MTFFKHDELCLRCFAAKELGDKFGITLSKDLFRELLSVSNNNTSDVPGATDQWVGVSLQNLRCTPVTLNRRESSASQPEEFTARKVTVEPPELVQKICDYLLYKLNTEGLFRISGSCKRISALKEKLQHHEDFQLTDENPHDVANILTQFLRQLSVHIVPKCLNSTILDVMNLENDDDRLTAIQLSCLMLPFVHIHALSYVMNFFNKVAQHCDKNRMSSSGLATILSPNVLELDLQNKISENGRASMLQHTGFVRLLIEKCSVIGEVTSSLEVKACSAGKCVHREEWLLMTEPSPHLSLELKHDHRRKSLANRLYEAFCGKPDDSQQSAVVKKEVLEDELRKQCMKRRLQEEVSMEDDNQPSKRRSLQGKAESVHLEPFPFNANTSEIPVINFVPDESASYNPIKKPDRHDSGSTSCFGNKAKSRRCRRSMRLSKPAAAFENRVSYPITDKDKGKENVTGQRLANHNCSLAADSSANTSVGEKLRKSRFFGKLTNSFLSPAVRRRSKAKKKGENSSLLSQKSPAPFIKAPLFPPGKMQTPGPSHNHLKTNSRSYLSASVTLTPITPVVVHRDFEAVQPGEVIDDSITIFDMSIETLISKNKGFSDNENPSASANADEDRRKELFLDIHPIDKASPSEDALPAGSEDTSSSSTPDKYGESPGRCKNEKDLGGICEEFVGEGHVVCDMVLHCCDDTSMDQPGKETAPLSCQDELEENLTKSDGDLSAITDETKEDCPNASSGLEEIVPSLLPSETAQIVTSRDVSEEPLFTDDGRLSTSAQEHEDVLEQCQSTLWDVIDQVVAITTNTSSKFTDAPSSRKIKDRVLGIDSSSKVKFRCRSHQSSPRVKRSKVISRRSGLIILDECNIRRRGDKKEPTSVEDAEVNGASSHKVKLVGEVTDQSLSCGRKCIRGLPPPVPTRTSSLQAPTVVEEIRASNIEECFVLSRQPAPSTQAPLLSTCEMRSRLPSNDRALSLTATQKIKLFEDRRMQKRSKVQSFSRIPRYRTGKVSATVKHFDNLIQPKMKKLPPLPCHDHSPVISSCENVQDTLPPGGEKAPCKTDINPINVTTPIRKNERAAKRKKSKSLDKDFKAGDDESASKSGIKIKNRIKTPSKSMKLKRKPLVIRNVNVDNDFLDYSPVKRATPREPRSRVPIIPF
ncbi:uncharacterized protein LOC143468473 [Clavelina lepadiformis]|uniref:Rho-GAP domain-containing protein n=1 Tax=Clavelina lepadiformis TaxID=159417 RepID=A0ABP0F3L0_CLALP